MSVSKYRNMNGINEQLKSEAVSLGLCEKWQNDWVSSKTIAQLIEMYKRGIDFCIEREWPSCDWITANASPVELHAQNLYISENNLEVNLDSCVSVVRESSGRISISRNAVVTLYCHKCQNLTIEVEKGGRLFLHLYLSDCRIVANTPHSDAKVYSHDEQCVAEIEGNVMIK